MKYTSSLMITNDRKNTVLILIFNGYIKTDEEAIELALSKSLVDSQDNPLLKATMAKYEKVATTRAPKDVKSFWDALDQLANGEVDEITNIFDFIKTIQSQTFNEFISRLPTRTVKGILFSLIKTKDFQVN